ncbi:HAD family hydrolase [Petrocella sp. FN5]|uniref:HAD family hydrolase n=1 Tax=Petrocella sp. FN5 TaxID=3032002 RepID=UPI0023DBC6D6|nr:HAD-IA family hydrolase [Petrocella sp. FN5]MDF1616207.1 HAD-IA family hydrolase [Petrocella sp. FN5]
MIATVIFDFDGTIINTNDLIKEGLNLIANKHRGCPLTPMELEILTGKTLEAQMAYIDAIHFDGLIEEFKRWYGHNHDTMARPFPGMVHLIRVLNELGYKIGIVTNNSRIALDMGLKLLGIDQWIDCSITRDDVKETKPSPEGILKALSTLGVDIDEVLFIGDTAHDILAAKAANVNNALVGWSHLSPEMREQLGPDHIFESAENVLDIIIETNCEVA